MKKILEYLPDVLTGLAMGMVAWLMCLLLWF